MVMIEILLGKLWKELVVKLEAGYSTGVYGFRLLRESWLEVTNQSCTLLHMLLPPVKGMEQDVDVCFHIEPGEAVLVSLESLREVQYWEKLSLLWAEECTMIACSNQEPRKHEGWNTAGVIQEVGDTGMWLFPVETGLRALCYLKISTRKRRWEMVYRGELRGVEKEGMWYDFPWKQIWGNEKLGIIDTKAICYFQWKKEDEKMGIISALLTGGILVGKVCQVIAGGLQSMVTDEETGTALSASNVEFDDLRFAIYRGEGTSNKTLHVLNCSDETKTVQFPADQNGNSLLYSIPGGHKQPIDSAVAACENPSDTIQIATVEDKNNDAGVTAKLHVENLVLGDEASNMYVYGYQIAASRDGILVGGALMGMTYCELTTVSGITITLHQEIIPEVTAEGKKLYRLDFTNYGIKVGDILSGQLHFKTSLAEWKKQGRLQNAVQAVPFTEADKRLLNKLNAMR